MYEFWYDYIKLKYQNNAKPCYMDIDSFILKLKIFVRTLQMRKKDLINQIMKSIGHCLQKKLKK